MSLPFYMLKLYGMDVLSSNLYLYCHIFLPYIMGFDIKVIHQRIQTTCSHASCCYHYVIIIIVMLLLCYSIPSHHNKLQLVGLSYDGLSWFMNQKLIYQMKSTNYIQRFNQSMHTQKPTSCIASHIIQSPQMFGWGA